MTRIRLCMLLGAVALLAAAGLLAATPAARAQVSSEPSASYSISWYTVDGGGATSSGGGYSLTGTAGQPDAGALSNGTYTLGGGFWAGFSAALNNAIKLFLPLVQR